MENSPNMDAQAQKGSQATKGDVTQLETMTDIQKGIEPVEIKATKKQNKESLNEDGMGKSRELMFMRFWIHIRKIHYIKLEIN